MADKSAGIDFDRQVFVQTPPPSPRNSGPRLGGLIVGVVVIAALAFAGYKLLPQGSQTSASASDPSLTQIDQRLTTIEERLNKLEETRRGSHAVRRSEATRPSSQSQEAGPQASASTRPARPVYRITPTPWQGSSARPAKSSASETEPATKERLATLQAGLGRLQQDQAANNDAWQATTNRLADMAGQVGTQNVQILRNQDELNELVNRTEMEAIPFELLRGSNPTPVGPVSLVLKSTNAKRQSYTLCVYVQPTCIELKDRMIHEVVQFVVSRNSPPLEVIATHIVKDEILGYLEVPRSQASH